MAHNFLPSILIRSEENYAPASVCANCGLFSAYWLLGSDFRLLASMFAARILSPLLGLGSGVVALFPTAQAMG